MRQASGTRRTHAARRRRLLAVLLAGTALGGFLAPPARADVATDGTVGRRARLAGPDVEVGAELGRVRGRNLFHSFERFGVPSGGRVTFTGPAGLNNVVSRVTGGDASRIDGTLRSTVPGADVYLVNPSGIVFGPGARLDVPGSFHASTADELKFSDGVAFSASDPGRGGLSVARPEAFGFLGGGRAGAVTVDRGAIGVNPGEALSLVGGDVTVTAGGAGAPSGVLAGLVAAAGGRVNLVGVGGSGGEVDVATGRVAGAAPSGTVRIVDEARVFADGGSGAAVIRGGTFELANGAQVTAGGADARGGGVAVEAGDVLLTGGLLGGGGAGVAVVARDALEIRGGGGISNDVTGGADGGPVAVEAGRVLVEGVPAAPPLISFISSVTSAGSTGDAGPVTIRAGEVELRAGAQVSSNTFGPGNAGRVAVEADRVLVRGDAASGVFSIVSSSTFALGPDAGDGGEVSVRAGDLELRAGGAVTTDTFGDGDGGRVVVEAGRLRVSGDPEGRAFAELSSGAGANGTGDGGSVLVRADDIELSSFGSINGTTFGRGAGGSVTVEAGRVRLVENATIASNAGRGRTGPAGTVRVVADEIEIGGTSFVTSSTFGTGDAGLVEVRAGRLRVADGAVSSSTGDPDGAIPTETGAGGTVRVVADDLELGEGGLIETNTAGPAAAGLVEVEARDIRLDGPGGISSSSIADAGPAGDVRVRAGRLRADNGAGIFTVGTGAEGGRIDVAADELIALRGSTISSTGITPAEGASLITLRAPLIALNDSRVTSLTGDGTPLSGSGEARLLGGTTIVSADSLVAASTTVETTGLENNIGSELQLSPGSFLDAGALLGEGCAARRGGRASSFTRAGRGGLPPSPDRPLASGGTAGSGRAAGAERSRLVVAAGSALADVCGG